MQGACAQECPQRPVTGTRTWGSGHLVSSSAWDLGSRESSVQCLSPRFKPNSDPRPEVAAPACSPSPHPALVFLEQNLSGGEWGLQRENPTPTLPQSQNPQGKGSARKRPPTSAQSWPGNRQLLGDRCWGELRVELGRGLWPGPPWRWAF